MMIDVNHIINVLNNTELTLDDLPKNLSEQEKKEILNANNELLAQSIDLYSKGHLKEIVHNEEELELFKDAIRELLKKSSKMKLQIKVTKPPVIYNNQCALKVPKKLVLKNDITKKSSFVFVSNPTKKQLEKINKSKLIVYLKESK